MKLKKAGKDAAPAADGAEAPTAAPKGGGNNLVPAVVLAIGLLGGGFFMGGKGGGDAAVAAPHEPAPVEHAEDDGHGPIQALDPITLNLADGHFLKVGIALQMAAVEEEGGGHGPSKAPEVPAAKALDLAISLLGSHTMDELAQPKARELVKSELSELVAEAYHDPEGHGPVVTKVYFTEFVMQ
jgi:flagellar protein FliL